MVTKITKTYDGYTYDELSDSAKDRVREWFAEGLDYEWYDCTLDYFVGKMDELGIEIPKANGRKNDHQVYFSGFYSQGDGAAFTADIDVVKFLKAHKATKAYWLVYTNIIRGNIDVNVSVKNTGHYFSMILDDNFYNFRVYNDIPDEKHNKIDKMVEDLREFILDTCRDYASDLYKNLENEYEYLLSDECIADSCEANEYLFDESGEIL